MHDVMGRDVRVRPRYGRSVVVSLLLLAGTGWLDANAAADDSRIIRLTPASQAAPPTSAGAPTPAAQKVSPAAGAAPLPGGGQGGSGTVSGERPASQGPSPVAATGARVSPPPASRELEALWAQLTASERAIRTIRGEIDALRTALAKAALWSALVWTMSWAALLFGLLRSQARRKAERHEQEADSGGTLAGRLGLTEILRVIGWGATVPGPRREREATSTERRDDTAP